MVAVATDDIQQLTAVAMKGDKTAPTTPSSPRLPSTNAAHKLTTVANILLLSELPQVVTAIIYYYLYLLGHPKRIVCGSVTVFNACLISGASFGILRTRLFRGRHTQTRVERKTGLGWD